MENLMENIKIGLLLLNDSKSTESLNKEPNPFESIMLIQNVAENSDEVSDLLRLRQVNSKWKEETTSHLIKRLSMKQIINFKTPAEIINFNETFKKKLLHDSFKFDFAHELKSDDEFYTNFVSLVGPSTKLLDLSSFDPNLNDFFSIWNWSYLKECVFGSSKAQTESNILLEKFFIEKILFVHFPNLVVLGVKEFKYTCSQHCWVFHSEQERSSMFNSTQLNSLTSLYITYKEKNSPKDPLCFLSDEIMRISPNLKKVKLIFGRNLKLNSPIKQILQTLVKYNLQTEHLCISTSELNLFENFNEKEINPKNFETLKIIKLTFKDREFNLELHQNRLNFFKLVLPLSTTIENFSHTSHKLPCFDKLTTTDEEFKKTILPFIVPSNFENLKSLKLMIQFPPNHAKSALNILAEGSPNIRNFTTSIITTESEDLIPWKNLNKLFFNDIKIYWDSVEEFQKFHTFVQTLAPSVADLSIHFECCENQSRKGMFLAYPFFVWMGFNWRLEEFEVRVNKRLKWNKGTQETKLGIESNKALSDENGNFTLIEISQFDLTLVLSQEVFMKAEGFKEFLIWLSSTFPKRTNFNLLVESYKKSIEEFEKLYEPLPLVNIDPIDPN